MQWGPTTYTCALVGPAAQWTVPGASDASLRTTCVPLCSTAGDGRVDIDACSEYRRVRWPPLALSNESRVLLHAVVAGDASTWGQRVPGDSTAAQEAREQATLL